MLEIHFLGGASGIGASCVLVELGERRVLVDAGVRIDRAADRLPDLAQLDGKTLDAIVITHAHADHIGALPLVHQSFPQVPIYATQATIRLMEVMLADAIKIMAQRAREELEIPLYDEALVASTLERLRPLPLSGEHQLPELPDTTVVTARAGHIAGAIMVGFETARAGRVMISGDVSMTNQRTILGAALPRMPHPDLLILESTYGARLHANRQSEEQRLALAVAARVQQGPVLIPAFALGRAQEVILILRAAQRNGTIPEFPIVVDGLVRTVCAAYSTFPEVLTPALQRHLAAGGRAFFGKTVRAVETASERAAVLQGPPCCIVASSGMLTGGPSAWYAAALAERPDASILLTGYQDEEAPGRRLQALAEGREGTLEVGGKTVSVRCHVGTYGLSAHADAGELAGLVSALKPRAVALVHGDAEARAALAARLRGQTEVLLVQDGAALALEPAPGGGRRARTAGVPLASPLPEGIGPDRPPAGADLEQIWRAVSDGSGLQTLSLRELARVWAGPAADEALELALQALLAEPQPYLAALAGLPGIYRLRAPTEQRGAAAAGPAQAKDGLARPDQTAIMALVQRHFAAATDLYHVGINPQTGKVSLSFFFPEVAHAREAATLKALREAGLDLEIAAQPHQGKLAEAALACLPEGLSALRAPALHLDQRLVRLKCEGGADPARVEAAQREFLERTGWRLELLAPEQPAQAAGALLVEAAPAHWRMEQNAALRLAEGYFDLTAGCYKIGADARPGVLTLRFHFPEVARERYYAELVELAAQTGWGIALHPAVHQGALEARARQALPAGLVPVGGVSLHERNREVTLRCQGQAAPDDLAAACQAFAEDTGWRLVLLRPQPA